MILLKKHASFAYLPILLVSVIIYTSCSTSSIDSKNEHKKNGWVDDNIFVITAIGKPLRKYTDIRERRSSAKRAALMNAYFKVLKKFKKTSLKKTQNDQAALNKRSREAARVSSIIKNGKIIAEQYDKNDNCEISYRVKYANLKALVAGSDLSSLDVIY